MHIEIRPYQDSDRDVVVSALIDFQNLELALHDTRLPGSTTLCANYLDMVLPYVAEQDGAFCTAHLDGVFVGFCAYYIKEDTNPIETPDSNRHGYVQDIYVIPEYRGRNIAAQMIDHARNYFRVLGMKRMRINVLAGNDAARRAYEKAGFEKYEVMYEAKL